MHCQEFKRQFVYSLMVQLYVVCISQYSYHNVQMWIAIYPAVIHVWFLSIQTLLIAKR
jgi:hypothetical protein